MDHENINLAGAYDQIPFYKAFQTIPYEVQVYAQQMANMQAQMDHADPPVFQGPDIFSKQREQEADMERLKSRFPEAALEIQRYVEEECDQMEYDGSLMFDEYPDQLMLRKINTNIYGRVRHLYDVEEEPAERDEVLAMHNDRRHHGHGGGPRPPKRNWMRDMIDVLLYNEMYRRRCRRRDCRRW